MKCVYSLISLKCILFLFYGAIGCLFPFLPLHMRAKELNVEESKTISLVAPCVALLGPLIAGIVADRLGASSSSNKKNSNGRYLRIMIAICFILAAIFYWLLDLVPRISKAPPAVSFVCDPAGGNVLQEKCGIEKTCHEWNPEKFASLLVTNCTFTCKNSFFTLSDITLVSPEPETSAADEYDGYDYDESHVINAEYGPENIRSGNKNFSAALVPHPHLCYVTQDKTAVCEVFTRYSHPIDLKINLNPSSNVNVQDDSNNETEICSYPIGSNFHCRIPPEVHKNLTERSPTCQPIVKCNIAQPYNASVSILTESECGYNNSVQSFWIYLLIRSVADIFPAAAVALLSAAVVIATRETSTGRGDVGKQLACGALGLAIFAPIVGAIDSPQTSLILFSTLLTLAAIIALLDGKMPLSPPEWWWHTRCGLVALPLSSIKKYNLETAGLAFVLFLLGVLWNGLDSFMPWHIATLQGDTLIIGLTITVGALPAVLFLLFAEKVVDYCGHTNLLIASFCFYIIHYIGLYVVENAWWILLFEALEIFTLHLMYATAVMYLRHLVPRKFTVLGQAIPVIVHFCLGRTIGALIAGYPYETTYYYSHREMHAGFAIAAAIIAVLYFLIYHCYLRPKYAAPLKEPPPTTPPALIQTMNGNGSYTPLRVYHNGRAKKGQFRY
ncbi:uncharacterized protein LOC108736371 [Agrilus planipennis]|uniref:Uncharacterized protein LOC108736371 n=1 Tax=Agrilus planipennis TaxID=224129 RepID=A0A1W4WK08_AGRPL|nr:uncharacterized protein LOC108736371 [Agrilus planipennis]XP_018324272.1 uncharacterized protein LOC108736371 [Agrilus planipennis]